MATNTEETLDKIKDIIDWLEERIRSENIVELGMVLDKLSIYSFYLGKMVSDAYELMNECEDDYKHSVARFVKEYEGSLAKAEREAEVEYEEKKRMWTKAKSGYKKLDMFLDRIDKVIESHRQRISVIKQTNLKNITGV
jgi:hypothetical protein